MNVVFGSADTSAGERSVLIPASARDPEYFWHSNHTQRSRAARVTIGGAS
jgi:hypothetical protein